MLAMFQTTLQPPSPFVQQLEVLLLSFLTIVVPAAAIWIKMQLTKNAGLAATAVVNAENAAASSAAASSAITAHAVEAKNLLNSIEEKVNGGMLQKDKTIASLAAVVNSQAAAPGAPPTKQV